jgi:predicted CoA-binding protein
MVGGEMCFPDLKDIPDVVDAVVIVTRPGVSEEIVQQRAERGVSRVWLHRSFGKGSVSDAAARFCEAHNITVIPGGCPMMFCPPVDFGHKCMRGVLRLTGGLPK